jgi:putative hydrolase of the HAD superfamily
VTKRPAAVVFDFWNTLVPYRDDRWPAALRELAEARGADPDALADAWATDRALRDKGELRESVGRVLAAAGVALDDGAVDALLARRHAVTAAMFVPREGAVETLEKLRERGFRTGLVTNCSSDLAAVWRESPLAGLVDACVFSCDERVGKPDPRVYALAAERLGVAPNACMFVGDGNDDELRGAANAGMRPVLLRTEVQRDWPGPAIDDLREVLELVA